MATKKYAQIVDGSVYWIFDTDVEPVFASNIVLLDITGNKDVKQGWSYDVKTNTFSSTPQSELPTTQDIYDNQIIVMNAIADLYSKVSRAIFVPSIPTNIMATAGNGSVSLSWNAPTDNGGSDISDYKVNVYSNNTLIKTIDIQSTLTTAIISGLTAGTSYTFNVKAVNKIGDSPVSPISTSISPT